LGEVKSTYHWQTNTIILSEFTVECLGGSCSRYSWGWKFSCRSSFLFNSWR